jgi:hypothetical protein
VTDPGSDLLALVVAIIGLAVVVSLAALVVELRSIRYTLREGLEHFDDWYTRPRA